MAAAITPPTAAPIIEIVLGGKPRKLYMGFRAYKKLKLNPFKSEELKAYLSELDIDKAAALLQAGMENADVTLKSAEPSLSVEEVVDMLDMVQLGVIFQAMKDAAEEGESPAPSNAAEETPPNP